MSQKLCINGFKWVKQEELSNFDEDFIKNVYKNSDKGYFLEVDINYPKEYSVFMKTYRFYLNLK